MARFPLQISHCICVLLEFDLLVMLVVDLSRRVSWSLVQLFFQGRLQTTAQIRTNIGKGTLNVG